MNENLNEVILRPRFKIELNKDNASVLNAFEAKKTSQKEFVVSRVDDHVFIKFPNYYIIEPKLWTVMFCACVYVCVCVIGVLIKDHECF